MNITPMQQSLHKPQNSKIVDKIAWTKLEAWYSGSMEADKRGMTIMEVLVVMFIMGVITATVMPSPLSIRPTVRMHTAAEDVLTLIKEARQRSLSVQGFGTSPTLFPNYGVAFKLATPTSVTVYADCVGNDDNTDGKNELNDADNFTNTPSSCPPPPAAPGNNAVTTHTIPFPAEVRALRFDGAPATELFIEFVRPEPTTWIANGMGAGNVLSKGNAEIDIGNANGTVIRTIVITTNGLITIQ